MNVNSLNETELIDNIIEMEDILQCAKNNCLKGNKDNTMSEIRRLVDFGFLLLQPNINKP